MTIYCDEHRTKLDYRGRCVHVTDRGTVAWHRPDILDTYTREDTHRRRTRFTH